MCSVASNCLHEGRHLTPVGRLAPSYLKCVVCIIETQSKAGFQNFEGFFLLAVVTEIICLGDQGMGCVGF